MWCTILISITCIIATCSLSSCGSNSNSYKESEEMRDSIISLRRHGKQLRNESRFDEALKIHNAGLQLAKQACDTSEIIQALNNIGTDYRRMGILDVAQEYHYEAWRLSEESSDTSFTMRKNRVVSLNGLGNIYLTIHNYQQADSAFRLALAGEQQLGSKTGQAINYANLGAIYNAQNKDELALDYYKKSLELNLAEGNNLGIALCHTYFGELHEEHGEYAEAEKEYETAYRIMQHSKDKWHSLEPLTALVSIKIDSKQYKKGLQLLIEAEKTASEIHSIEHLAKIHMLYYKLFENQGLYHDALIHHVAATAYNDSIINDDKNSRIHNTGITIERNRQKQKVELANEQLAKERNAKWLWFIVFTGIAIVLITAICVMLYIQKVRAHSYRILKEASNLRENFFTNITHEFRTPLTIILGLSEDLAKNSDASEPTRKKLDTIHRQGNRLLTLITQLLDISKIKLGCGEPDWRQGNIATYITMIAETYSEYASTKGINLSVTGEKNIVMDFVPDYLNKVIGNLLSNALKYTPTGGKITINIKKTGENATITCSDTGCGINSEHINDIFTPFFTHGTDTEHCGTGVGLALIKQIVETIGGTVNVKSEEGIGTEFTITVPIHNIAKEIESEVVIDKPKIGRIPEKDEHKTKSDYQAEAEQAKPELPKILVVEDNADVAEYIGSQFENSFFVLFAQNGKVALDMARENAPKVIITDVMMPEMDGLSLCKAIRSDEKINHIPIIVVTAKITEDDKLALLQAGADAYITKPFNADELRMRVDKLLEQRRLLREKFSQMIAKEIVANIEPKGDSENSETEENNLFIRRLVEEAIAMLDTYKDVNVSSLAEKMQLSTRQLHRRITAITGKTPVAFIQMIKVKKAQKILEENPQTPFKTVAIDSGFTDYSSFARVFKSVVGITPSESVKSK